MRPDENAPSPAKAGLPPQGWLMPVDVAREAGVSTRTVRAWCAQGRLHAERLPCGHRRIPAAAWHAFRAGLPLAAQVEAATAPARQAELEARIRAARSPQEVLALLRE